MDSLAFSDYKRLSEFSRDKAVTRGDTKNLEDNASEMNILMLLLFHSVESKGFSL